MNIQAPRVTVGQPITARVWNQMADAVNAAIHGPRDLTEGVTSDESEQLVAGSGLFNELARTTSTVRITNPEDENQYVDVERITSIVFRGPGGSIQMFHYNV